MGKKYAGEKFPSIKTEEQALKEIHDLNTVGAEEGAVDLDHYFVLRSHKDPTMQAAMRAFTDLRKATPEKWDEVFKDF